MLHRWTAECEPRIEYEVGNEMRRTKLMCTLTYVPRYTSLGTEYIRRTWHN